MTPLDAATLTRIGAVPFSGTAWRHLGPARDPLSGEGARIHGGRFNPPESYPVLYCCLSRGCAVAEFMRMASRNVIGPAGFLPWRLFVLELELTRVLDLTDPASLEKLGIGMSDLVDEDRAITHEIGVIAHGLSLEAIRSPSATRVDEVLALFPDNLGSGRVKASPSEEWTTLDQIDLA